MDYDPNKKFNYWTDEMPLDLAIGGLLGVVLYVLLSYIGVLGA